ncbi:GFA family protein [Aliikangiella sp. IMCC44632]
MEQPAIENKSIQGGCYCGRVKYQVQLPVKWCAHCHCNQCRHIQGAAVVTWFGVNKNQFNYLQGESAVVWFQSSQTAQRAHCIHCATPLFFRGEKWPDEIHITRESTQQDILQKPQIHVFYDRHVNYLEFNDSLEKFGGLNGFSPIAQ